MKPRTLTEVAEPNLLEDQFDYSLPPKIKFEGPIFEEIDGEIERYQLKIAEKH